MVIFLLKNDVFLAFRPGNSGKKSYAPPLFRPGNSGKKAMHPPFFRPGNSGFSKSTRPSFSHLRVKNAKKWPKKGSPGGGGGCTFFFENRHIAFWDS